MPKQRSQHWKAYLALSIGILILGGSAIFTRLAEAPGAVVSFYRMAIGTAVLALPFALRSRGKPRPKGRGLWLALLAGVLFGLDLAAWASGVNIAGATIPTLMGNMAPVWVGLGAWLLFKEKLGLGFWAGLAVALAGALVIVGIDFSGSMQLNAGALFGMVSGFFYGSYLLVSQRTRDVLDALSFFWISALGGAVTLLILALALGDPLTGYSTNTYLNFLALGVIVQGGGWLLINYAQGFLPASLVAPTLLLQPVLTAFIAGPLLGEWLTPTEWLGGAAVLAGIVIVYRARLRKRAIAEPVAPAA
jgi:drug/metabolite transporter (DMT)-like permease